MLVLGETFAASAGSSREAVAVPERRRDCDCDCDCDEAVGIARAWEGDVAWVGWAMASVSEGGAAWAFAEDDSVWSDFCRRGSGLWVGVGWAP